VFSSSANAIFVTPLLLFNVDNVFPCSIDQILIDLSVEHEIKYLESNENSQSHTHFLCPTSLVFNLKSLTFSCFS